ncbi:hypothetical protein GGR56DRAFT_676402 [Xylariaceae sp. FL0804]|nr:hypothetical protein GGR56DRAFT_676402 [Xylariaceae sp. FL0804]
MMLDVVYQYLTIALVALAAGLVALGTTTGMPYTAAYAAAAILTTTYLARVRASYGMLSCAAFTSLLALATDTDFRAACLVVAWLACNHRYTNTLVPAFYTVMLGRSLWVAGSYPLGFAKWLWDVLCPSVFILIATTLDCTLPKAFLYSYIEVCERVLAVVSGNTEQRDAALKQVVQDIAFAFTLVKSDLAWCRNLFGRFTTGPENDWLFPLVLFYYGLCVLLQALVNALRLLICLLAMGVMVVWEWAWPVRWGLAKVTEPVRRRYSYVMSWLPEYVRWIAHGCPDRLLPAYEKEMRAMQAQQEAREKERRRQEKEEEDKREKERVERNHEAYRETQRLARVEREAKEIAERKLREEAEREETRQSILRHKAEKQREEERRAIFGPSWQEIRERQEERQAEADRQWNTPWYQRLHRNLPLEDQYDIRDVAELCGNQPLGMRFPKRPEPPYMPRISEYPVPSPTSPLFHPRGFNPEQHALQLRTAPLISWPPGAPAETVATGPVAVDNGTEPTAPAAASAVGPSGPPVFAEARAEATPGPKPVNKLMLAAAAGLYAQPEAELEEDPGDPMEVDSDPPPPRQVIDSDDQRVEASSEVPTKVETSQEAPTKVETSSKATTKVETSSEANTLAYFNSLLVGPAKPVSEKIPAAPAPEPEPAPEPAPKGRTMVRFGTTSARVKSARMKQRAAQSAPISDVPVAKPGQSETQTAGGGMLHRAVQIAQKSAGSSSTKPAVSSPLVPENLRKGKDKEPNGVIPFKLA